MTTSKKFSLSSIITVAIPVRLAKTLPEDTSSYIRGLVDPAVEGIDPAAGVKHESQEKVSFRVTYDVKQKLEVVANRAGLSVSQFIRRLIEQGAVKSKDSGRT